MEREAPVRPGEVLAQKYRVDRVLGVGGMGVVVAATHLQLDQHVALKFMLPEAFANPEALSRFQREARAAVKLKSEHVARVLDVGTFQDNSPYIVMEFLEGTDLAAELERGGPIPLQVVAEYIVQACDAMAEAHAIGIVHRDLKPANLFLTRRADGSPLVKVLDFGISKANPLTDSNGALQMTKTTAILGSPQYMSPEQMKSSRNVDARTDVWSLGIILYELLGGRAPFQSDTLGGLMAMVMTEPHAPLEVVRPDLPRDVCGLVNRCLSKDPSYRPANVAELAQGLAPYCPRRALPIVERVSTLLGSSLPPIAGTGAAPAMHTGTVVVAGPRTQGGAMQQMPAAAISGLNAPSPSWGTTGSPVQKRSSAALWIVLGLFGVGGVVAVVVVLAVFKQNRAAADVTAVTSAIATSSPSAAAATASAPPSAVVLTPSEPTASASAASSASGGRNPAATLVPPLPPVVTRPTSHATAPATTPTAKPVATTPATATAPAQKPGILDTSN
jgi:serine/threonine-protein kinase